MKTSYDNRFLEMVNTKIEFLEGDNSSAIIIPLSELEWNSHQGVSYLYLKDVSEQLLVKYPEKSFSVIVTHELGLSGIIYRYDSDSKIWNEIGSTKGYA